jgi:hypothetical protein
MMKFCLKAARWSVVSVSAVSAVSFIWNYDKRSAQKKWTHSLLLERVTNFCISQVGLPLYPFMFSSAETFYDLAIVPSAKELYIDSEWFYDSFYCKGLALLLDLGSNTWERKRKSLVWKSRLGVVACELQELNATAAAKERLEVDLDIDDPFIRAYWIALCGRVLAIESLVRTSDGKAIHDRVKHAQHALSEAIICDEGSLFDNLCLKWPDLSEEKRALTLKILVQCYLSLHNGGESLRDERETFFADIKPLLYAKDLSLHEVFQRNFISIGRLDLEWKNLDLYERLLHDVCSTSVKELMNVYGPYSYLYYPLMKHAAVSAVLKGSLSSVSELWNPVNVWRAEHSRLPGANMTNQAYFMALKLFDSECEHSLDDVLLVFNRASMIYRGEQFSSQIPHEGLDWRDLIHGTTPTIPQKSELATAEFILLQSTMLQKAMNATTMMQPFNSAFPNISLLKDPNVFLFEKFYSAFRDRDCVKIIELLPQVQEHSGTL